MSCRRPTWLTGKVMEKFKLVTSKVRGKALLADALADESGSSWPEAHYLGPLHPVIDWAADRAMASLGRNQVFAVRGAVDRPDGPAARHPDQPPGPGRGILLPHGRVPQPGQPRVLHDHAARVGGGDGRRGRFDAGTASNPGAVAGITGCSR